MSKRSSNESGTPCWVELTSTDVEGSKQFYGELFGWDFVGNAATENAIYTMCFPKGDLENPIAAMMSPMQMPPADEPPADMKMAAPDTEAPPEMSFWATYVSVDDIQDAATRVTAAGGHIMMEPMEVTPLSGETVGKMAVFMDPAGAALCLWEPMAHIGATIVNEPGTYCWSELNLPTDIKEVLPFYQEVFGWQPFEHTETPMGYTEFKLNEQPVAGGMTIPADAPGAESMPPHWAVYFAAKDVDATHSKAQELGAMSLVGPMDIPGGRFATMLDPQGAAFSFCWMHDMEE